MFVQGFQIPSVNSTICERLLIVAIVSFKYVVVQNHPWYQLGNKLCRNDSFGTDILSFKCSIIFQLIFYIKLINYNY
jgi:hypothetical protein